MKLHEISNPINNKDIVAIYDVLYGYGINPTVVKVHPSGVVDVTENVSMVDFQLNKFKVQFGTVYGDFSCAGNPKLTSLKGCPSIVKGNFRCYNTGITSLQYAPHWIGESMVCFDTNIKSLSGIDKQIKYIGGSVVMPTKATHLLGLLLIDGIRDINVRSGELDTIMNKYLGTRDILSAQDELIDAGFKEQARL